MLRSIDWLACGLTYVGSISSFDWLIDWLALVFLPLIFAGVTIVENSLMLNGQPLRIISGTIHYFRIVPEYWHNRLQLLKASGCNCVETYVAWNAHEPLPGQFDFQGIYDIRYAFFCTHAPIRFPKLTTSYTLKRAYLLATCRLSPSSVSSCVGVSSKLRLNSICWLSFGLVHTFVLNGSLVDYQGNTDTGLTFL